MGTEQLPSTIISSPINNYQVYSYSDLLFFQLATERGFVHHSDARWNMFTVIDIGMDFNLPLGTIVYNRLSPEDSERCLVYEIPSALIKVTLGKNRASVQGAGKSIADITAEIDALKVLFPPNEGLEDSNVSVEFWYNTQHGPNSSTRLITAPTWNSVSLNYPDYTRAGLDKLMREFKPSRGGQLILWHGLPGTGKTYSLRALLQAWKGWCSYEYIVDPEECFGRSSSYLMQLVMDAPLNDDNKDNWRLFILEDSGEFLTLDARENVGQALSRLLNLVDGFIGQGLKILVLITTNESIEKLHPAIARPGRCAANIKFESFTNNEASIWLKEHKSNLNIAGKILSGYTLADLYSIVEEFGIKSVPSIRSLGFQPPNSPV